MTDKSTTNPKQIRYKVSDLFAVEPSESGSVPFTFGLSFEEAKKMTSFAKNGLVS